MTVRPRSVLVAGVAALGLALPAAPAQAKPAAKPDTACQKAGIKTLQAAHLLDDVARQGLPITTAVALGVTVRPGADITGLPAVLPLPLVLADHRAGDNSLFVYPWCGWPEGVTATTDRGCPFPRSVVAVAAPT